jgi:hypothetical protein
LDADQQPAIEQQLRSFFQGLRTAVPSTPIVVLSQLAEGADQLVASLGLQTGCESACVLPLDVATYRTRFGNEHAREAFDRLLAASVIIELPGVAGFATQRERGYAAAGTFIARHATILLALWDGVASTRPGSTADLVRARTSGWVGSDGPAVYHLVVRRRDSATVLVEKLLPDTAVRRIDPDDAEGLSAADALEACGWRGAEEFNATIGADPSSRGGPAVP